MSEWLRKILMVIVLIAVIAGSFWISFMVGKQLLMPTKKLPSNLIPPQLKTEATASDISIEVETDILATPEVSKIVPAPVKTPVKAKVVKPTVLLQVGVFSNHQNATKQAAELKAKGFSASVTKYGKYYRVTAANTTVSALKAAGFEAVVTK
ncbi:hypothetical protein A2276_04155 [candidate division WOR-1 bacterium RIFOXYA12_FULL_43_27]|uniref:SPOR domain-containing protein n=1 Tax=candidate division WOR-1 bacterium RIFOXYC2_FULL_46_14 TaxID=1802587 RepID=A0A1F4U750_UNCSA|nr:MAG: hypothetical protein A2276_04155 [candidate division WOR-1 bacterium RIFOXYA12_FULL_43_27]OGC19117.1 MAG: hypothetical protein A2292_00180 [candidate division WOR-1 bacterium RIFOXYB2_FULL_46_45]OGC30105.1 MAG: hypothetical protein A2232_00180 [candidate division WOR-1 bacterium RIFOXYA2_FULL_46_56]OGC40707.1 MAG: hypothetical protein A2438_00185 [candidate division WOR-1 bacterium RIFOXYC2_FULL_46_14]